MQVNPVVPFWISSGCLVVLLLVCMASAVLAFSQVFQPTNVDVDRDRLTNEEETQTYFTDPQNPDTDGDGLLDGEEIPLHLNPRMSDTDGDGLVDGLEIELETNPLVVDSDGDTIPDGIEVNELETNPLRRDSDGNDIAARKEKAGHEARLQFEYCFIISEKPRVPSLRKVHESRRPSPGFPRRAPASSARRRPSAPG